MPVTVTGSGVQAICAVIGVLGAFFLWSVRQIVRGENEKLLVRINGTYVRSMSSTLTGAEIQRSLTKSEDDLGDLSDYVHERLPHGPLHRHIPVE